MVGVCWCEYLFKQKKKVDWCWTVWFSEENNQHNDQLGEQKTETMISWLGPINPISWSTAVSTTNMIVGHQAADENTAAAIKE